MFRNLAPGLAPATISAAALPLLATLALALFVYACSTGGLADARRGELRLDAATVIVVADTEPIALRKAAADLAEDLSAVFGRDVRTVSRGRDAGATAIVITADGSRLPGVSPPEGREQLLIQSVSAPFGEGDVGAAVVLTGSDLRGAIYAVYEFSERFLGVRPLHYWIDQVPERRESVAVARNYRQEGPEPTVRYRGLFINDEDLLSGWMSGTWRYDAIRPEAWDHIYEAILRMKGNMVTPGTFNFPYEPQVAAAAERGLIHTQDHVEVIGMNALRWPQDVEYSLVKNRDKLISAWSKAVEQYPEGIEIIWTLGYRGLQDRPFWEDAGEGPPTDAEKGRQIREAIDLQMEIVRARHDDPYFLMNTWGEGAELIRGGHLEIPEDVHLVWADDGRGIILDEGEIEPGQGAYYHTAMFNSRGNQLSEQIPPGRIQSELTRMIRAGATEYLLVNCSDLRPVVMTTQATMAIAYDASAWLADDDYHETYLREWCADNFGEAAADEVAAVFNDYYAAPAQFGREFYELTSDVFFHRYARHFLRRMISNYEKTWVKDINGNFDATENAERLQRVCGEANARWEAVLAKAEALKPRIPAGRRNFYEANVMVPIRVNLHSNRVLRDVALAHNAETVARKTELLDAARPEVDAILAALERAEYGKWKDFYLNDLMVGLRSTQTCIDIVRNRINGRREYREINNWISEWDMWDMMKAYQGLQRVPM